MAKENSAYVRYAALRDEKGVTDYAVATATGIVKSTFSDWKNGAYTPKYEKLRKIADYFGVTVDYFLADVGATGVETG